MRVIIVARLFIKSLLLELKMFPCYKRKTWQYFILLALTKTAKYNKIPQILYCDSLTILDILLDYYKRV